MFKSFLNTFNILTMFIIILACIFTFILLKNLGDISILFDIGYEYRKITSFLNSYLHYVVPLSLGYALLLGYIGLEKGKIIGQGVQGSHFQIVTLIYHILNFVLIPFIIYLSTKGNWGEISSLLAFVIVVGGTSNIILQKYSQIRASYKQLLDIHKDGLRKDNIDISTIMKEHKIPFYYVSYLSYLTVTLSILIFPINTILEFNIFSILYIHISLVSIYVLLSILKNKFPPHVTLRYCGKVKKGFLIEHGKINTVLLMETKTVVIRTDMIESIETI